MNKTICTSDFSFDDEILRKLNESLDNSLRKHSQSYSMRIDIDLPKDLDQKKKSTFLQGYTEKIKGKKFSHQEHKKSDDMIIICQQNWLHF